MKKPKSKNSVVPYSSLSRREFIKTTALVAGASTIGFPAILSAKSPNEKLNIVQVGAGGKGSSDTDCCATENILALCDVDENTLRSRGRKYPKAKLFHDYRRMFDALENEIDAVIVSTPDNHHASAGVRALRMGKNLYCQKPLTYCIAESRLMRETARKYQVATQMGNQGSAGDGLRRGVEVVQAGAIGPVHEVHVWSNRPIWPQGMDRPAGSDAIPTTLHWDLWVGPQAMRPFKNHVYQPFVWRGWQDFGTGALGDMACHTVNLPFRALKWGYPTQVEAETSGMNHESYPKQSKIRFEFPASGDAPAVRFWWYDGGWKPSDDITQKIRDFIANRQKKAGHKVTGELPGSGCVMIGEKGQLYSPDDYGTEFHLLPEADFEGYQGPTPWIPRTKHFGHGLDYDHHQEWIRACKGGRPGYSNFEISAFLAEIILLGDVALRCGKRLDWDGPNMRATNAPEADQYIHRKYRRGWEL